MHFVDHLPSVKEVAKSLLEARIAKTVTGSGCYRSNWRSNDSDCPRFETFIEHFAADCSQNPNSSRVA